MMCRLAASALAVLLLTSISAGQITSEGVRPDNIDPLESSRPIVEFALAGGFLLGVLAIAFKNSKRTQAD